MFKNIKQAHEYYKYPGSYRTGTIYDENGVENEEKSQRVVFRVKADSGETIRKLLLEQ